MKNFSVRNLILMILMMAAAVIAIVMHPTHKISDDLKKIDLEAIIPAEFGAWRLLPNQTSQIINPQQKEMIDKIYSQTLSRTYANADGRYVMLVIAYGDDQSDAKQLHYPEVCYPAQGFQVLFSRLGDVKTKFGDIRVKRMSTALGNRLEPITYWTTVGEKVVRGSLQTKLAQLNYGVHGLIPDGMLIRFSSINGDTERAFEDHQQFIDELLQSMQEDSRVRLIGTNLAHNEKDNVN